MIYSDANVLTRYYLQYDVQGDSRALLLGDAAMAAGPIPVPTLLRLEVSNAFQRLVFETKNGGLGGSLQNSPQWPWVTSRTT